MALDKPAVSSLRREFPALDKTIQGRPIIFFDGPGGTQVHGSVIDAMVRYFNEANSNSHGNFLYSHRTDKITHDARAAMADFLNASRPEEIVFGPNMTTLTFRLSRAVAEALNPGDEIVVTRLDHDANIAPWAALQQRDIVVHHVDIDPDDCTLDMEEMERVISKQTRLVAVGYASNAVGTINDVCAIADLAHAVGAWVFVDAVHYAPHGPIDVQDIRCDLLVCSAYKFFGPHLGILYGRHDLLDALSPRKVRPAGDEPPDKFERGTSCFEAISGAAAAVDYLASVGQRFGEEYAEEFPGLQGRRQHIKTGMAAIRDYERELCQKLISGLFQIPGLSIYGITEPTKFHYRVPTVSFVMDGLTPEEIARFLAKRNIFVWDGNFYAISVTERLGLEDQGGLVRIGLCHYNTAEEVETFIEALARIQQE